ncbi:hypothetical protein ACFVJS_15035 [Nocardioides sp. NPDC057772]|uniref:hypothetical protein n=1 Tax=Nocardioides sp. NPDC057772 TaxID=3346245 RepID=UPI0036713E3F
MSSMSKLARFTVAPVAAVVAIGLASPAAFAASSYNVSAGSAAAGSSVAFGAQGSNITFHDETAGTSVTCSGSSISGSTTVGQGLSGTGIATLNGSSVSFTDCTGPLGIEFTITGSGSWALNATGDTASGTTAGNISGITAKVSGSGCSFTASGSVAGNYTNGASSGTLSLPGSEATLTLANVSGFMCGMAGIANGDKVSFAATYAVNATDAANNPIAVTSNA